MTDTKKLKRGKKRPQYYNCFKCKFILDERKGEVMTCAVCTENVCETCVQSIDSLDKRERELARRMGTRILGCIQEHFSAGIDTIIYDYLCKPIRRVKALGIEDLTDPTSDMVCLTCAGTAPPSPNDMLCEALLQLGKTRDEIRADIKQKEQRHEDERIIKELQHDFSDEEDEDEDVPLKKARTDSDSPSDEDDE